MFQVKMGYISGYALVFSAFQPDGTGRGIQQQPLPEVRPTGFYHATPITDLVIGDEVLAYILEPVLWEGDPLYILTEDSLYWEGDRLYWEGEWLFSADDIISETLTWVGDPVGQGEFSSAIDISVSLGDLLTGLTTVVNTYDSTSISSSGQMQGRQISAGGIGYWPL